MALETEGLTKVYGSGHTEVVAMRDVSMSVRQGEVVALLGPSGAGKSTFLLCAGLINLPTRGRVTIGGKPVVDSTGAVADLRRFRRENIGFIFQKSNLIPFLNAVENVQIVGELIGRTPAAARRRAMQLLNALGVGARALNRPTQLSGGEQQRVTVARALANQPSLILADEPTAALDSKRGRQVMGLFRDVAHQHGTGVIVVTHDHRALDVFDTVYEMEDGVIGPASHELLSSIASAPPGNESGVSHVS
ncbi:MAG: ABC transporter ATP-binding protein [Planctomycetia bacterium]|nr:ABC transporter ATP-binding protein [Planctomycetia bacterium]MCC7313360.1 ABC transporter ATP-binding protein [Planctomycetota bacterium]